MSTKQIVQNLLRRLPEDVSLHQIARKIDFSAGVHEGFETYEREGGMTAQEAKMRVTLWAKRL